MMSARTMCSEIPLSVEKGLAMIEIMNEPELEFNDNDSEYDRLQKMLNESDVSSDYSSSSG